MPNPSIRSQTQYVGVASPTFSLSAPAGVQDGDYVLVLVTNGVTFSTSTVPAGFTALHNPANGRCCAFGKVASSEPASYTFGLSSSGFNCVAYAIAVKDCSPVAPLVAYAGQTGSAVSNVHIAPSVTSNVADGLSICAWSNNGNETYASMPAGYTQQDRDSNGGGNAATLLAAYATITATGATGTKNVTGGGFGGSNYGGFQAVFGAAKPITLVPGGALSDDGINGQAATFNWPTLLPGDVCYVAIAKPGTNAAPSGYTQLYDSGTTTSPTTNITLKVFRKVQGSTPDTSVTSSGGTSAMGTAMCGYALRGVDPTTPEDATTVGLNIGGGNPNPSAITTVTPYAWVLEFEGGPGTGGGGASTGYTNSLGKSASDDEPASCGAGTREVVTPASTDPGQMGSLGVSYWATATLAVRPLAPSVNGPLAVTEEQDTAAFTGVVKLPTFGTMGATEAQDVGLLWNPHNLFLHSEDFTHADWNVVASQGLTAVADTVTAPNGTTTADKLAESLTDVLQHTLYKFPAVLPNQLHRASFHVKAAERTVFRSWSYGGPADSTQNAFNLSTGEAVGALNPATEDVGGGWWRCSFDVQAGAFAVVFGPYPYFETAQSWYAGVLGYGVQVWGAQLNAGPTTLPYAPTTGTAYGRYGVIRNGGMSVTETGDGLIAYAHTARNGTLAATEAQDVLDAGGGRVESGALAVTEAQDVARLWNPHNLVYYSEELDNAAWNYGASGLTISANVTTAPDGTTTADKLVETASSDYHRRGAYLLWSQGQLRRFAFHAKSAERTFARGWSWGGGDSGQQTFNLTTGVAVGSLNPAMEDKGNGWWRCSFDVPAVHGTCVVFGPSDGLELTTDVYPGDGVSGIYAWGASLTYGPTTTDYDKTTDTILVPLYGVVVAGTLAPTEVQDTAALSGSVTPNHYGTLAATEAQDTLAASGSAFKLTTGTLAATDGQDVLAAEGYDSGVGTMAVVEQQDVFAGVGTHTHLGTFAATEAQDVFACLAQIVRALGTLSVVEAQDVALFAGQGAHAGTLAALEAADSFVGVAYVFQVGGTLAATDDQDVALFIGAQYDVAGDLVATEAQDAFSGDGISNGIRYGTLDVTEAQDDVYAVGWTYGLTAGMPGAGVDAEGQQLEATVGPEFDLDAEAQTLDLTAAAQALTGDASATAQTRLGVVWVEAVFNDVYSALMPLNPLYRDVVGVSDGVPAIDFGKAFYDSVQILDTQAIDRARISTETVVPLDVFALAVVWVRAFSEQVTAQDAIHVLAPSGSIFSDSVVVADLTARIVALQKDDYCLVGDQTSAALIPRPSESASVTDSLSRTVAYRRTFDDVAIANDQMAIATTKRLMTPVSVADQKRGGWGKSLADGLFTADTQHRILGKGPADMATVSDASSVSVAFRRTFGDVVFATDIFSTITNDLIQFSDSVTMVDARVRALTKPHVESVTLTDGRVVATGKLVADTVMLASAGTITGQGYANNYFAEDYVSGTLATFT